jgi:hypothetical protein
MPQKIYSLREAQVIFREPVGFSYLFTPKNIATNTGWVSDRWDRGSGAAPERYIVRGKTKVAAAATAGTILTMYVAQGDGTDADAALGTGNAALPSVERRRNLTPIGVIVADGNGTNVGPFISRPYTIELLDRYVQIVWFNEFGVALTNVAADHTCVFTPVPWEVEDAT